MTLGWGLEWGNLNFALGTNHFVWDRGQWAKQWPTFWCLHWSKRGDLVKMATRRKKLGGVSLNLDPKSQLTSVSSISDQDADTLMALRGLDGKLSIADVVSKTNLTEEKIVSLAKKGILMAQFSDFDLEAEIQEAEPVDYLSQTVVKLSGEMETMMGRMQSMEQKQGSLQDQISSMREVNCASAVVMDGIERRQKQMLDFLQQQTEESSQALQAVREQLLEQSKLIQQQATDRQETDGKEPMASQSRREEVLTQGASQFDTVLMRGHSGNVSSTPTVQSRLPFAFPPPRPPVPAHFPPHYLRRPEVFSQDQVSHQSCMLTVRERMILWMRKVIPVHGTWSRKRWNHRGNIRVSWFMIHHRKKACERHILPGDLGCLIRRFDSGRCWKMAVAGGWIIFRSTQTGHLKLRRRRDKVTKSLAGRDIGHHLLRRIAGRIRGHRLPSQVRDAGAIVIVIGHRHQSRQTSQVIGMTKGVSTNTSRTGVGSQVALVTQAHIVLDGTNLRRAVDIIRIMSVMCPLVSRLIVSQLNQGTNTRAVDRCRHFLNFRPLTVKQLSGVGSFSNSASWQNQVVGQNVRNGIDCWDVCEERLLPTCRVGQSQSKRTTMPWKSSWINAMESWSCRLQPDGICSPWGKKRLKAWMTSLTGC